MVNSSFYPFTGPIHPQGVGRRVPRCCTATLSLAVSRARSLLACGMSRRSLIELLAIRLSPQAGRLLVMRGSLRCTRDTVGRSPLVWEREAAGLPAPNVSHRRVRSATPKNEFLEVFNGGF